MNSPYLNAQQVDWVCKYCLRVIETYAQSGRGNVKADVGAVSSEDAVKEAYKEVRALLRMLTHLSSGNLHDAIVESAPPDQAARLAEQIDIASRRLRGTRRRHSAHHRRVAQISQTVPTVL